MDFSNLWSYVAIVAALLLVFSPYIARKLGWRKKDK